MITTQVNNGAPSTEWFAFLKSLDWRDDRIYHQNIRSAFKEALRLGVWFQIAFTVVAETICRSGGSFNRGDLKELWHLELSEWDARQKGNAKMHSPAARPPYNFNQAQKRFRNQAIVKSPAPKPIKRIVVIDGTNVLFGSVSSPKACLLNLLGLVIDLMLRGYTTRCFFDANTKRHLEEAARQNEAEAFVELCLKFPDIFIRVPGGNRADEFLLADAHSEGAPVVSNDQFRAYQSQYKWLHRDSKRWCPFLVHNNVIQITRLTIRAAIPKSLASAEAAVQSALGKSSPANLNGFIDEVVAGRVNSESIVYRANGHGNTRSI